MPRRPAPDVELESAQLPGSTFRPPDARDRMGIGEPDAKGSRRNTRRVNMPTMMQQKVRHFQKLDQQMDEDDGAADQTVADIYVQGSSIPGSSAANSFLVYTLVPFCITLVVASCLGGAVLMYGHLPAFDAGPIVGPRGTPEAPPIPPRPRAPASHTALSLVPPSFAQLKQFPPALRAPPPSILPPGVHTESNISPPPTDLALLVAPEVKLTNGPFCTNHGTADCNRCKTTKAADGRSVPPLLYLHVQKTGGSSIECSTAQTLAPRGIWNNMGHTWQAAVNTCLARCKGAKIVLSVREPYQYWRSSYTYAFRCSYSDTCTSATFKEFMRSVSRGEIRTQSSSIHSMCGQGSTFCKYDHVIHTETMLEDFIAILDMYGIGRQGLPHANPTGSGGRRNPGRTIFDAEIVAIINRVEARMMHEFGYQKRQAPFELT